MGNVIKVILEKKKIADSRRVNQILHRVDNLMICTPKNRSHLRATMALDLITRKKDQADFFAFDKFTLQNLATKSGYV